MESDQLLERFLRLQIWSGNGQRAPHKPLLALWAIGRCLRGEDRLASYEEADRALTKLLRAFGPHRKSIHTEAPFWRLQGDGVWEVRDAGRVTLTSKGDATRAHSWRTIVTPGSPKRSRPPFGLTRRSRKESPRALVKAHFPSTIQEEVLEAVGIETGYERSRRKKRDRGFKARVLSAYGHACAVCGFAVRRDNEPVALEAAHIKWHEARGPDLVRNALSLCALHHRLFDKGAFTVSPGRLVIVARNVSGRGFEETLGRFDTRQLRCR